jgi:copper chaperone CopZ
VTIKALGMDCEESCPVKVRHALAEVPAVYELGFDLSTESIFVSYDASLGAAKQVTRPMIAAIKRAGFDPWLAKESWPDGVEAQVIAR